MIKELAVLSSIVVVLIACGYVGNSNKGLSSEKATEVRPSNTVESLASSYSTDFDLRNMAGFDDNKIGAEDIVAFIQEKYPNSPMLDEADIGNCFINAGQSNDVNPAFLVATACLEGGFGTLGWAASHPECHNTFGYGIPSGSTKPDDYNCMNNWCAMVQRVASVIAHGNNYYAQGRYTIRQVREKYAVKSNEASIAELMNELYTFSANSKDVYSSAPMEPGGPLVSKSSAVQPVTWNNTFGDRDSEGYSIQQTNDGGYILTGVIWRDYGCLIKTDNKGNTLWSRIIPGYGYSVQQTKDGGYIITGRANGDAFLLRTDAGGNEIWNNTLGVGGQAHGYSVQQTGDGGYIVTGDGFLLKADADGNELWNKPLEGIGYSVQQASDGGYIIASSRIGMKLIKTDAMGNVIWSKDFSSKFDRGEIHAIRLQGGHAIRLTTDNGYIITGSANYANKEHVVCSAIFLLKTDADGNELWNRTFIGKRDIPLGGWNGGGQDVQRTQDGGYIITGAARLIRTDDNGMELWNRTYGNDKYISIGRSVQQTKDGGYVLTGSTGYSIWLIKTDTNGNTGISTDDFADGWYKKGVALANQNKYDEALKAFEQVLRINPNDTSAQRYKCLILAILSGNDLETKQKCVMSDPNLGQDFRGGYIYI